MSTTTLLRYAVLFLLGTHKGLVHVASGLITTPRRSVARHQRAHRFINPSEHIIIRPISCLCASSDDDDNEEIEDKTNLDQQKLALENMLKNSSSEESASSTKKSSVLTTSRKQRLEIEIDLLKQLDPEHPDNNSEYSDLQNQELVMAQLWSLWYGERGPLNARILQEIEGSLDDSSKWGEAEKRYLELIREHCSIDGTMDNLNLSNWVEPANRLATLLYLMGRLKESKKWCEQILSVKPWHIGALSGVVMVCMKMGDKEGILKYSVMGMPNLSPQMRNARKEWVDQNVQLAENNLQRLEQLNREAYGQPDEDNTNYNRDRDNQSDVAPSDEPENEDSAWQ